MKMQDMKMMDQFAGNLQGMKFKLQDMKMTDQICGHKIAKPDNTKHSSC